jgi:hypothetical protein
MKLKDEIETLNNQIKNNEEAGIKYYLNLLKEGKDNRNVGLSWIVKRLLRLDYTPKLKDFPDYINKQIYEFFIINAKNKNKILDCLQELGEIKHSLNKEKHNINKRNHEISDLKYSLNNNNSLNNELRKQLERLLKKYSFWVINPEIKNKINSFCLEKTTKQFVKRKDYFENKIKRSLSFKYKISQDNSYIDKNEILKKINRVFELKNIIEKSYMALDELKHKIIKYIKNILNNDENGTINENSYLIKGKIKKNSLQIKIIRNLIGDENKLKNINLLII